MTELIPPSRYQVAVSDLATDGRHYVVRHALATRNVIVEAFDAIGELVILPNRRDRRCIGLIFSVGDSDTVYVRADPRIRTIRVTG